MREWAWSASFRSKRRSSRRKLSLFHSPPPSVRQRREKETLWQVLRPATSAQIAALSLPILSSIGRWGVAMSFLLGG